ncbi:MAG: 4Fe-4S dicluster domain-containing protein [Thermodesulfobacteriota bacterium]
MTAITDSRCIIDEAAAERIRQKLETCIQCGTCSGSCPNAHAMDVTPRGLWRLVITGRTEEIFETRSFSLCSECYCCTLRCPRGLALTDAMAELKRLAAKQKPPADFSSAAFHKAFLRSVRRWGRVQETRMMSRYMTSMAFRNPLLPLKFLPLGIKLLREGKMTLRRPGKCRSLEDIFNRVEDRGGPK